MNLETLAVKLQKYDTVNSVAKTKLIDVLKTVRVGDTEDQAIGMLFSIDNRGKEYEPYNFKKMIFEIIKLISVPSVYEHLPYPEEYKVHSEMLSELFSFFDYLDNEDYDKLKRVEDILEYGEELPSKERPYASRNADWLYEVYVTRPTKLIENLIG